MKIELRKLLEKLVSPAERMLLLYARRVASMKDMPTALRIFTSACFGLGVFLILNIYLFIVAILMSTLLVVFWLGKLKNRISKKLTALLAEAPKLTSMFTQGWQRLLKLVKK